MEREREGGEDGEGRGGRGRCGESEWNGKEEVVRLLRSELCLFWGGLLKPKMEF